MAAIWRCQSGHTGILFAVSIVPLMALAGGGVDLAQQSRFRVATQSALDTATLAAARDLAVQVLAGDADRLDYRRAEDRARAAFDAVNLPLGVAAELTFRHAGMRVMAASSWKMATSFLPLIGMESLDVSAYSEAEIEPGTETCVYVTAQRETGIYLHASSALITNCGVRVESSSDRAISATASSDMEAADICSNGDIFLRATSTVTPMPIPCADEYSDPLRYLGRPAAADAPCEFEDLTLKGHVLLRPGVYCGTTTVAPSSHAALQPGEYVFRSGELQIAPGSSASGENILLYFQGPNGGLSVGDGAKFEGHGRVDGDFAGLVIYTDRDCEGCRNMVQAGGTATLEGTVYAPSAPFTVQSRASTVTASHTLFIVYQILLEASASLSVELDSGTAGVPKAYKDSMIVRMVR